MSTRFAVSGQPQIVLFKGIFDFDELYKNLHEWFIFKGYTVHENKYKLKAKDTGKEKEINLQAWRKVTDFVKNWFLIHIQVWNIEPIEVVKDGEKKVLMKARLMVRVEGQMECDYNDRFEGTRFKRALRKFLLDFVLKGKIDSMWADKVLFMQHKITDVVKQSLDMQIKGNEHFDVW